MATRNKMQWSPAPAQASAKPWRLPFWRDGYGVALAGRRRDLLEHTAAESANPAQALVVPADVRDADAVHALFARVKEHLRPAGSALQQRRDFRARHEIDELSVAQWKEMVDTNLTGSFLCAREAFRLMKTQNPRGGRIINNGSISAHAPRPNSASYTATKHAITGLTKAIISGRTPLRYRLRPDRYRQRRHRHGGYLCQGSAPGQWADGGRAFAGPCPCGRVRCSIWPVCRSKPTSSS